MITHISNESSKVLPGLIPVDLVQLVQLFPRHPLVVLTGLIPWEPLEDIFHKESLYSEDKGRPALPVRVHIGLQIYKYMFNLSDSETLDEFLSNFYLQYMCGYTRGQFKYPCTTQNMCQFRKKFGEEELKQFFSSLLVKCNLKDKDVNQIIIDSSCFEKNIRFPGETRLRERAIKIIKKMAKKYNIKWRRSYRKELKALFRTIRFENHSKKNKEKVESSKKRVKAILGILLRDFERKKEIQKVVLDQKDQELFDLCNKVQQQEQFSDHKLYSLHEPQTACVAKAKAGNKTGYEFGTKVAIAKSKSGFIVAVVPFENNPNDAKTTENIVQLSEELTGLQIGEAIGDRGYDPKSAPHTVCDGRVRVSIPESGIASTPEEKKENRAKFARRAGIEPVFQHVKDEHRARRNFLHGRAGDRFNAFFSCIGFNLKKLLNSCTSKLKTRSRKVRACPALT